jgi:hypothetical protein
VFAFCSPYVILSAMKSRELLKALLDLPEMSSVGSTQERVAFISLHIEGRTVRETAQMIGVSKSQVPNLATLFLTKLGAKIQEFERKRIPLSKKYLECRDALQRYLYELQDESGSNDFSDLDSRKIGTFNPGSVSREDWSEVRGLPLNDRDE